MPNKLTNLRIDEVSSVDRGAGLGVRVLLMKRATDMPDKESKRETDAYKALALAVDSIGNDKAKLVECFKQFHAYLSGDEPKELTMDITKEALDEMIAGAVAKALEEIGKKKKPAKPENENTVDRGDEPESTGGADSAAGDTGKNFGHMTDDAAKKFLENLGIKLDKRDEPKDTEVAKAQAEIVDLRKHIAELQEKNSVADFAKRAEMIGLPSGDGEQLRKAYKGDVNSLNWLVEKIGVLTKQVEKAGLFGEVGSGGGAGPMDAQSELKLKADELRKTETKLTAAQAYVKAMEMFPDIAKREREEAHQRIQKLAQ